MKIVAELTDQAILRELGERLQRRRIDAAWTQARLAEEAGVSKRTVERMESGESTDILMLLRVLRALQLVAALDGLVPELPQSPLALLRSRGRVRKRVGHPRRPAPDTSASQPAQPWKWRD